MRLATATASANGSGVSTMDANDSAIAATRTMNGTPFAPTYLYTGYKRTKAASAANPKKNIVARV